MSPLKLTTNCFFMFRLFYLFSTVWYSWWVALLHSTNLFKNDSDQRFSWSPQTVYKVICFMSDEFCSHSETIRWSFVFFNGHHKVSAVICFISNELCSHSWKIRWSSVFLFYLQAKGFHPSLNTQSCIRGLLVVRDFCFWAV